MPATCVVIGAAAGARKSKGGRGRGEGGYFEVAGFAALSTAAAAASAFAAAAETPAFCGPREVFRGEHGGRKTSYGYERTRPRA